MNDPTAKLVAAFEKAAKSHTYRLETASLEFTEALLQRMKELGLKRAELARRLGTSAAYVSKLLNGPGNLTLESLIKIAEAVGCELRTHLVPKDCDGVWINVSKGDVTQDKGFALAADSNELALAA